MDIDKLISERQSIREFKDKDLDFNKIGLLLDAATKAPSSGNVQNWKFFIVKNKEKRDNIAKACLKQYWMNQAPVHIVICSDDTKIKVLYPKLHKEFSIQNTATAATYILLKATDLKLGACWIAVFDKNAISKILKLPPNLTPQIIIPIGYQRGKPKVTKRYPVETCIYFEEFGYAKKKRDTTIFPLEKQLKKLQEKIKSKLKK